MPYKLICQLFTVYDASYTADETRLSITPNNIEVRFIEQLGRKGYERGLLTPYWLYIKDQEDDHVYKGVIQTIYDTWGVFRVTHFNDIQKYDFLYAFDHREQLMPDSVGILYELT